MHEINCYDSYGNTINYLTQWDYNRQISMYIDNFDLTYAPEVHFCNQRSTEALVVQSSVDGNKITAEIPNILLQEHLTLCAYVYLSDANNASSQKTILSVNIPVRYRPKPSEYTYIENISKITAAQIQEDVYNRLKDNLLMINSIEQSVKSDEDGGVNIYTITLTDGTTGNFEVRNGSEAKITSEKITSALGYKPVDSEYIVSVFEELKKLIQAGNVDSAIAVLDEAILDLHKLA